MDHGLPKVMVDTSCLGRDERRQKWDSRVRSTVTYSFWAIRHLLSFPKNETAKDHDLWQYADLHFAADV